MGLNEQKFAVVDEQLLLILCLFFFILWDKYSELLQNHVFHTKILFHQQSNILNLNTQTWCAYYVKLPILL